MIKLIIFDGYGVSINGGYPDTMKELGKHFHTDWKKLYAIFYTKYFNMAAEKKITQKAAWELAIKEANLPMSVEDIETIHFSNFSLNMEVINYAKKLEKKYTVLLLTKNTVDQLEKTDQKIGIKKHFANIINTFDLGLKKAGKETMEYVFKKFNVKADEVIYIEDQDII